MGQLTCQVLPAGNGTGSSQSHWQQQPLHLGPSGSMEPRWVFSVSVNTATIFIVRNLHLGLHIFGRNKWDWTKEFPCWNLQPLCTQLVSSTKHPLPLTGSVARVPARSLAIYSVLAPVIQCRQAWDTWMSLQDFNCPANLGIRNLGWFQFSIWFRSLSTQIPALKFTC